ncbi:hypothetical protein Bca52824_048341 [Brassica carinata]|uniref:Uncharacterized protein n=1 Tax=Brassica carinata TaxID=52824 RepID=A0A8X7US33_BRACI|nr:hypothetical protein Bca52824_048341 [Brassica carinata]
MEECVIHSPADHGLITRSPVASGGFCIAAQLTLVCAFRRTGHMLAVGIMVPKVTSVRQFRLNFSLYVSGPMARAGAPRSSFSCISIPLFKSNILFSNHFISRSKGTQI